MLTPPEGGSQSVTGGGSGGDDASQRGELTWDGDATLAIRHYAERIEADGWTAVTSGGSGDVASGTWTKVVDDGPQTVTVSVVQTRPDRFSIRLDLASHESRSF